MAQPIVLKRSPVVIIRNLIVLELLATVAYFVAAVLGNYGEVYGGFTASESVSYELAKFLFIILAQVGLMGFIFLHWFFQTYSIYPDMVVNEWGIVFKRRKIFPLKRPLSISCHYSPLARIFKYGSLILRNPSSGTSVIVPYLMNPEMVRSSILEQQDEHPRIVHDERAADIKDVLSQKEGEALEFKTAFRWDVKAQNVNKNLEKTVLKTIAAFLNTDGGHVVIGVGNGGEALGLAPDYATLRRQNADGFETHFTNIFRDGIGAEYRQFVKLSFHAVDGKEVCLVRVLPAAKPAYVKTASEETFFIRTGNSTTPLPMSKATVYIRSRWKEA